MGMHARVRVRGAARREEGGRRKEEGNKVGKMEEGKLHVHDRARARRTMLGREMIVDMGEEETRGEYGKRKEEGSAYICTQSDTCTK